MTRYAIKRVVLGLPLLWAASVLVFVAVQALPGNATFAALGRGAPPALDTSYPYPNGQISDNQGDSVGLDVGDSANGISLAVLPGTTSFDIMSYCTNPVWWMSGYTFAGILNELRAALAKRYLRDHEFTVTEITWLLGYREVSSFTHAFKRWTGMTPRQFRSSS